MDPHISSFSKIGLKRRIAAFILSLLLPGWGHILLGFVKRGVAYFVIFILLGDLFFLAFVGWIEETWRNYILFSTALFVVLAWLWINKDMYFIVWRRTNPQLENYIQERFRRAILAYLQDDYPKAESHLKKILKRDPYHRDAFFYLGLLYLKMGMTQKSLKALRKCILLDWDGKWNEAIYFLFRKKGKKE